MLNFFRNNSNQSTIIAKRPARRLFERLFVLSIQVPKKILVLLIPLILLSVFSCTYQSDEFTFSAPMGFKTKQYKTSGLDPEMEHNLIIFSEKGHLYFQVIRQGIPQNSDLETVFNETKEQSIGRASHYQFISQNLVTINDRPAIEYVHREFLGEPYEQIREIWIEYNGRAYALVCTNPVDSTPGLTIPVSEMCFRLVDGFRFK